MKKSYLVYISIIFSSFFVTPASHAALIEFNMEMTNTSVLPNGAIYEPSPFSLETSISLTGTGLWQVDYRVINNGLSLIPDMTLSSVFITALDADGNRLEASDWVSRSFPSSGPGSNCYKRPSVTGTVIDCYPTGLSRQLMAGDDITFSTFWDTPVEGAYVRAVIGRSFESYDTRIFVKPSPIPVPGALLLMISGLSVFGVSLYKKRKAA